MTMANEHAFKTTLREIREEIKRLRTNPSSPKIYLIRVSDIEHKFRTFYEDITPKRALSDQYTCIGRMRFYGDEMLFLYLEIADNQNRELTWPVRATWKVELVDENDEGDNDNTFLIDETTCIFNKPKQGFVSHPNDWISVSLEKMRRSELVARDNSVILRWSVVTQPVLHDVYLDNFSELLNNAEDYYDLFHGREIQKMKEDLCAIKATSEKHKVKISSLETTLPEINSKLGSLEDKINYFIANNQTQNQLYLIDVN